VRYEIAYVWHVHEMTNASCVTCYLGGVSGMTYSLPRTSDYLEEQKMDVVSDTGKLVARISQPSLEETYGESICYLFTYVVYTYQSHLIL